MFICASLHKQKITRNNVWKYLLCGPLGGDTAPKVVAAFSHAGSQHKYPEMHEHTEVQMQIQR